MSFTEDAATQWDKPSATKVVIPQEDRNFQRPTQPFKSTVPLQDVNMASDSNTIMQFQNFLRGCPLGICYNGPIDGELSTTFLASVYSLEEKANKTFNTNITLKSGEGFSVSGLNQLKKLIQEKASKPKIETTEEPTTPSSKKKSKTSELNKFQKFFKLPIQDTPSSQFITKIKQVENTIAHDIDDSSVIGMIWKNNKLNITFSDFINALRLIKKYKE